MLHNSSELLKEFLFEVDLMKSQSRTSKYELKFGKKIRTEILGAYISVLTVDLGQKKQIRL